jgi:tetratricopeptide (TPR) repeat protein
VTYVAFISYSHADTAIAKRLHRWLESYRIPRRLIGRETPLGPVPSRLRPIFRDREELPTSADLGEQIGAALRASQCMIVICSPRAAQSRWVNEEVLQFKRLGRAGRIVCLIVDGEPNASDKPGLSDAECFPPALRFHLAPDGTLSTNPAEPIAADIRVGKDGRRDAFLKLAAGIAGVGFDELKQRELQRQLRRAIVVSVASTGLLLTMAGLTFAAVLARQEALHQRELATAERDRAEANFRDARDAVDRFYTKVSEEQLLRAEGLQPLRADLLREALEYYRRFLSQRRDDPAFALEAAIVQANVGGILGEVGDPEEALAATHEATIALERLHRASADNARITSRLSGSLGDEAVSLDRLGRTEDALACHDRAISLFENLPADCPDRTLAEWQRLLTTKGAFEAKLGRFAEAAESYERSLATADQAPKELAPLGIGLEDSPGGLVVSFVQPRSPAAIAGIRVGDRLTRLADVDLTDKERMADVRTRMTPGDRLSAHVVRGKTPIELALTPVYLGDFLTASTKYNLGYLYLQRLRQPDKAKPWLAASVDEYRRTLLRDSAAAPDVRQGLAFAACVLGTCGYQLGDTELWEEGLREGVAASEENVRENPNVPRYRTTLAVNLANLAALLEGRGDLDEAAKACNEAVTHLEAALAIGGNLAGDRFQLLQALTNLGMITNSKDGPDAAIPIYEAALQCATKLRDTTGLAQSMSLARAQLNRNYASSLRAVGRLADAAMAYDESLREYVEAVAETAPTPPWLLREVATLECWRAALLRRLARHDEAAAGLGSFADRCAALTAIRDQPELIVKTRAAAVEAFVDAAMNTLPDSPTAGRMALVDAEMNLEQLRTICGDTPADSPLRRLLDESELLTRGGQVRAAIRADLAAAWQPLRDWIDTDRIDALPINVRIDLAVSLLAAEKQDLYEIVLVSIRNTLAADPANQARIVAGLDETRRCGASEASTTRIEESLGIGR